MGFWSALGSIAGLAAAPFTGGASMIPGIIAAAAPVAGGVVDSLTSSGGQTAGNIGQVAGSAADAQAKNRIAQGGLTNSANRNLIDLFNSQGTQAKDQAAYAATTPTSLAQQAVRGDLISNGQDASFSGLPSYIHVPTQTGGLRPSLLSAGTRQMGSNLTREAMMAQLTGEQSGWKMPGAPTAPTMAGLPEASGLESTLSGVGLGGSLLSAASPLIQQLLKKTMPGQPPGFVNGNDFSDGIPTDDGDS